MPLIGKPMLSTMLAIRSGGIDRADFLFDLIGQARRFLDSRSGWCAHVNSDRAGIDRGEEILSEERSEAERRQGDAEKAAGEPETMLQRQFQQAQIAVPQSFEMMFEPALEAGENSLSAAVRPLPNASNDGAGCAGENAPSSAPAYRSECRRRSSRRRPPSPTVGTDSRRPRQARAAGRKRCRCKTARSSPGRMISCAPWVMAVRMSSPCSSMWRLMFSMVTVASSTRMPTASAKTAERHHIDRLAERRKHDQRAKHRQRYRHGDDEGRAPAAEKDQDHEARQRGRDKSFANDGSDGGFDEARLIGDVFEIDPWRKRRLNGAASALLRRR